MVSPLMCLTVLFENENNKGISTETSSPAKISRVEGVPWDFILPALGSHSGSEEVVQNINMTRSNILVR